MEENSIKKLQAWNPIFIGVLSFLFSFLPAGIFYAVNFERLGQPQKKNSSLIMVILGFIIFTAAVYFTPEDINPIPFFTIINAAVSGYFIYSQKKLYEQHMKKGGEKAKVLVPVIVSILWFIFIILAILYIPFGESSELDLNPGKTFVKAAYNGNIDIIRRLIDRGIDINVYHNGRTALFEAAIGGKPEILKLLLQEGANANAEDKGDIITPLYLVAMNNRGGYEKTNEIIILLVEGGADINTAVTENKITPLMWLAENGNIEGVKYLVEKGADVHLKRKDDKTALSLAIRYKKDEIIKILKANGAKD